MPEPLRLFRFRHIHMIGIKGAGMTALAELLCRQGIQITGTDTAEIFFTDAILEKNNIEVQAGFDPANIPANTDAVIYSTAYAPEKNPELAAAMAAGSYPVMSYPEALGLLTHEKLTLAVCGTHGKTTTSALLADTLRLTGMDPSAIVGSRILTWEGNALSGSGQHLILEADEYQNKLRLYQPYGAILTSVDWDHPDFFPDVADYEEVFIDFVKRIPRHGILVYCSDSAAVVKIASQAACEKVSYGFLPGADMQIKGYAPKPSGFLPDPEGFCQEFRVWKDDRDLGPFRLKLAGRHNALNATAVLAMALFLRQDIDRVKHAFEKFTGTTRRFEYVGERFGAPIYDDYAHHPEEVRATLQAFRELYPDRKLRVIFHPHTFSRTKALLTDFAQSFEAADQVFILDIYGSAREEQGGVSAEDLVRLINRFFPDKASHAVGPMERFAEELDTTIGRQDVIITLGAGNVWEISHALARRSKNT